MSTTRQTPYSTTGEVRRSITRQERRLEEVQESCERALAMLILNEAAAIDAVKSLLARTIQIANAGVPEAMTHVIRWVPQEGTNELGQ